MSDSALSYVQISSSVNPSFWSKLTELKLNVDKLDESSRKIWGFFRNLNDTDLPNPILEVDSTSFNVNFDSQNLYIPFHGKMFNKNTIEQFKECNKVALLGIEGKQFLDRIQGSEAINDPSILNFFLILSFADLKKYHYYYWFAFPVLRDLVLFHKDSKSIKEELSIEQVASLYSSFQQLEHNQRTYFIVESNEFGVFIHKIKDKLKEITAENYKNYYFAFYNISYQDEIPGSQLRNYVAFILNHCPFLENQVQKFIAFHLNREKSTVTCSKSRIYNILIPEKKSLEDTWVGWEKNERDKMGPRLANMKNTLDPNVLAENSVDLNLKLMKWRVMPNIDLDKIKGTKCLLLGSGTLGCSVARTLLAWGVRTITFVDNSTVSFSNPVRQSLFTYQDSVDMKTKSAAAADNLKAIFPGVISTGYQINIPMPGHTIGESMLESTKENVERLTSLIQQHDVIFLLMDSRESRWLPTLLSSYFNKIVINAALGFDTYLVMRHGSNCEEFSKVPKHPEGFKAIAGNQLGCYFCNDVTAPGNSMKDRTLDQQCTVTRPGVSQIAGSLAVELAISILQHEEGSNAPAFYKVGKDSDLDLDHENQGILGLIPHSIRGFLSSFNQILPATQKFKQCIACSEKVLEEYKENGIDFLIKVFNSSKFLEDFTGLSDIYKETDNADIWEFSDDDDNVSI